MTTTDPSHVRPGTVDSQPPPRRVGYEPGLDGLRAVALLAIFVVHADVGWAPGGFLAVSTFFTLSGFLITALLVSERASTGGIDLRSFWRRRVLRLMPASLMAIAAIAVATVFLGDPVQIQRLGGDVIGALAYVANWRFLLEDTTYAAEFAGQSPLLHFWSLAIEEQFYLVFPLIMWVVLRRARNWRRAGAIVLGSGILASLMFGILRAGSGEVVDRLYFRTEIRAGELLVGALVGLWWVDRGRDPSASWHRAARLWGVPLLGGMVALIATSDYRDLFWYRGGLIAYSFLTVGVVLAAVEPEGPLRRILAWKPLVEVGVISYGAYLVHWPLFMWLSTKTSIGGAGRLVGGTAVALGVALLSHRLIEQPVRHQRSLPSLRLAGVGASLAVVALVVSLAAPSITGDELPPLEAAEAALPEQMASSLAAEGEAPTVGVFGDSTALVMTGGLAEFDDTDASIRMGSGSAGLGCTLTVPAQFMNFGEPLGSNPECDGWQESWAVAAAFGGLDLALVQFGPWEVKELKPEGADEWEVIGEPARDADLERRLEEGLAILRETVPIVAVMTSPDVEPGRVDGRSPGTPEPDADPARMDRINEIITEVAGRYDDVAVIDFASWLNGNDDDRRLRPDGVHLSHEASLELAPRMAATLVALEARAAAEPEPGDPDDRYLVLQWVEPV